MCCTHTKADEEVKVLLDTLPAGRLNPQPRPKKEEKKQRAKEVGEFLRQAPVRNSNWRKLTIKKSEPTTYYTCLQSMSSKTTWCVAASLLDCLINCYWFLLKERMQQHRIEFSWSGESRREMIIIIIIQFKTDNNLPVCLSCYLSIYLQVCRCRLGDHVFFCVYNMHWSLLWWSLSVLLLLLPASWVILVNCHDSRSHGIWWRRLPQRKENLRDVGSRTAQFDAMQSCHRSTYLIITTITNTLSSSSSAASSSTLLLMSHNTSAIEEQVWIWIFCVFAQKDLRLYSRPCFFFLHFIFILFIQAKAKRSQSRLLGLSAW